MRVAYKRLTARAPSRDSIFFVAMVVLAWVMVWRYEMHSAAPIESMGGHQPVLEFYSPISPDNDLHVTISINPELALLDQEEPQGEQEPADPPLTDALIEGFGLDKGKASNFAEWIEEASQISGVPMDHLSALIATESSFRYEAESWAGAVGPAQVMPRFWSDFCDGDLYDPRDNIICGARVLAHYRESCPDGDWACAFKKYNVGPSGYRKASSAGAMNRYITKIRHNHMLLADVSTFAP